MNNSAANLGSKLAEKLKQDAELIEQAESKSQQSIEAAQVRLGQHLQRLLSDVKITTDDATRKLELVQQLTQDLKQSLTADQIEAIKALSPILSKLTETKTALDQLAKINSALTSQKTAIDKAISSQTETLETTIQSQTQTIQKLIRMPLLYLLGASLAVALLIPAMSWVLTPKVIWSQPTTIKDYGKAGSYQVMLGEGWTNCPMDDNSKRPCRKVD